ncbi:zinc ABC transporter substrate-binding protein [Alteromonas gracilis]
MKRRLAPSLMFLLVAPLAACGVGGGDDSADGAPVVTASFYPLAWAAQEIAGDAAEVVDLTPAGTEPHDLELTVRQRAEVASADAVFYIEGFQPSVDEAAADKEETQRIEAGSFAALAPSEEEGHSEEEHAGEEGHSEEEHAEEEGHDHGEYDPHVWLDPTQFAKIVTGFGQRMAELDADNAQTYLDNADRLRRELAGLDREMREGLAECTTRTVVTSHDAFGYLGRRYDLDMVSIAGLTPDAEPSAQQLAAIRSEAQDAGITTVFSETLASPALAETLARELDVQTAVLDPLEGLAPDSEGDYLSVMRENLAALQQANGCS